MTKLFTRNNCHQNIRQKQSQFSLLSQPCRPSRWDVAQHTLAILAFRMVMSCWAITDSTSMSMRLNSSKQHQAPDWARPLKNRPIIWGGEGAGGGVRDQLGDLWLSSVMITCDYRHAAGGGLTAEGSDGSFGGQVKCQVHFYFYSGRLSHTKSASQGSA